MIKCAPTCGAGCTQEQYDVAVSSAEEMAASLGEGWTTHIWENLGWHYSVASPHDTITVFGKRGVGGAYLALISEPGKSYGQGGLDGHGYTPQKAVADTVTKTRAEIRRLEGWLEGLD